MYTLHIKTEVNNIPFTCGCPQIKLCLYMLASNGCIYLPFKTQRLDHNGYDGALFRGRYKALWLMLLTLKTSFQLAAVVSVFYQKRIIDNTFIIKHNKRKHLETEE